MPLGPIEIVVLAFPGNRFTGEIIPELERLVQAGTISIVDGLFAKKDADGACTFVEIDELGADDDSARLATIFDHVDGLLSDEDVADLMEELPVNSSAALLVFEHSWVKPLRDAIVASGGELASSVRIPGAVADEVLAALAESS